MYLPNYNILAAQIHLPVLLSPVVMELSPTTVEKMKQLQNLLSSSIVNMHVYNYNVYM